RPAKTAVQHWQGRHVLLQTLPQANRRAADENDWPLGRRMRGISRFKLCNLGGELAGPPACPGIMSGPEMAAQTGQHQSRNAQSPNPLRVFHSFSRRWPMCSYLNGGSGTYSCWAEAGKGLATGTMRCGRGMTPMAIRLSRLS